MFEKIGGRKLVISALVFLIGGILVALMGDIPPNFLTLMEVTVAAFMGGNAASALAGAIGKNRVAPPAADPEATAAAKQIYAGLEVLHAQLNEVKAVSTEVGKSVGVIQQAVNAVLKNQLGG
jgi:hypothetical protein